MNNSDTEIIPPDSSAPSARLTQMASAGVPSIIPINPQIATTLVWVAVGFGLCWWLTSKQNNRSRN